MKKIKVTWNNTLPKTIPLLLRSRANEYKSFILQRSKDKDGKFQNYTYGQVYEEVLVLATALRSLGVDRNTNVAIISDNRREWLITDFAIQSLGAVDVPRGCDSLGNEIRFILSFADCKFGFFENERQLQKVLDKIEESPQLRFAILFDEPENEIIASAKKAGIRVISFTEIMADGKKLYDKDPELHKREIEKSMEQIQEDDTCTIIFTSGTTGIPKGVMLTHRNYMAQMRVIHNYVHCKPGDTWMTILPVWHSFERLIQYVAPTMKCSLAYSKPVAPILLPDMDAVRPQWICGVPRLWEALASGVDRAMRKKGGISFALYNFFIKVGKIYSKMKDYVRGNICQIKKRSRFLDKIAGILPMILLWPLYKLGDILVFKKIRAKFGGNISVAISGGGALQKNIDNFYRAIGLTLLEGYGLTESAPVISFRHPKFPRAGCVGMIFPTFELKIVKENHGVITSMDPLPKGSQGMILVRGQQVMKGYYKRPDLTDKIIDKDGWLNTGDIGLLTLDGEIKITGRAKDTIVLLDGENIEPAIIESALCTSEFIESALVLGQDQKYLGSLIVPSKDAVVQYAQKNGIDFSDYEKLLQTQKIQELFSKEINDKDSVSKGFRTCEKIFKFALIPNSFKVGEELSAKQEMMRYKIVEKYAGLVATLF